MIQKNKRLPVEAVLPELKAVYGKHKNSILVAPPGAGKTTRVPLALLEEPWLKGQKIIMLEPRRLAARAAAQYMAALLGERVGQTVGYRVHLDTCIGSATRIEVVTEGILTRMLQSDPSLEGVGLVIFDEFHERSLQADVGFVLCLQAQTFLREDLRMLVMSATLEVTQIADRLGNAPVIESKGQAYPVTTMYLNRPSAETLEQQTAAKVLEALQHQEGDILVFLPGEREIRRVEEMLSLRVSADITLAPLYGRLPQSEQDAALLPDPLGRRKVILATSIAETSLTVEGVCVVVDSGWMRRPVFSPGTGLTRLETVRVSLASAKQRAGRAGRLGPGVCYRLWTEQENRGLEGAATPEILSADLASLVLELALWGSLEPEEYLWLDAPPPAAFAQACELLRQLGALDAGKKVTGHGRQMAQTGLHPRLAHMILKAIPMKMGRLACQLAVLLSQRDIAPRQAEADLTLRLDWLGFHRPDNGKGIERVRQEVKHLEAMFSLQEETETAGSPGLLVALAYPDRIGQNKGGGRFVLRSGRGVTLAKGQPLALEPFIAVAHLDNKGADGRIFLAAPLPEEELYHAFEQEISEEEMTFWDQDAQRVKARKYRRLGALVLKEEPVGRPDREGVLSALFSGIRQEGLRLLPWTKKAKQLWQRMAFLSRLDNTWPDVREEGLLASMEDWLAPFVYDMTSAADLQRLSMSDILESLLSWEQRRQLEEWAPTHLGVPSGQRVPLDYSQPEGPVLAVRLQEMFGLRQTPLLGGGKVPIIIHLLSPAGRPVQVTRDLASFWETGYFEVKKDLKGRYPKHYWPDNPLQAIATHRVRPKESS